VKRETDTDETSRELSMKLEGSCHCGAVRFSLRSAHPYPFNHCYCSICRKTAGGGGYTVNISGDNSSLEVEGEANISIYQARTEDGSLSPLERRFCKHCGSALWCWDPRWPDLIHPQAGAIDTELPAPPERTHLMLAFKPNWVSVDKGPDDRLHDAYPDESIAAWHDRFGLTDLDDLPD